MRGLKLVLAVTLVTVLSGCAEYYAGKEAFRSEARAVAAEAFETARYTQCRASTAGAVGDEYGDTDAHWLSYRAACASYWRKFSPPVPAPVSPPPAGTVPAPVLVTP